MENFMRISGKVSLKLFATVVICAFFFGHLSCSKENIQPISNEEDNKIEQEYLSEEKGTDPFVMLSTGKLFETKITNSKGKPLGVVKMISDGEFMKVFFRPDGEKVLMAMYLHYELEDDFPVDRRSGLPSLERFDYKYEFIHRIFGNEKSIDDKVLNLSGKLVFKIPIQDVPKSGIMALQVRCKNNELDDHYNNNGLGWMDGTRFTDNSDAAFMNYSLGWKF